MHLKEFMRDRYRKSHTQPQKEKKMSFFLIVFECVIRARMRERERERAGTSFHIFNSLTRQLRERSCGEKYFNLYLTPTGTE